MHSSQDHSIITLIISDRRDTRDKWPLARNPDRSWWNTHTSLKLFWLQPMAPWTAGKKDSLGDHYLLSLVEFRLMDLKGIPY